MYFVVVCLFSLFCAAPYPFPCCFPREIARQRQFYDRHRWHLEQPGASVYVPKTTGLTLLLSVHAPFGVTSSCQAIAAVDWALVEYWTFGVGQRRVVDWRKRIHTYTRPWKLTYMYYMYVHIVYTFRNVNVDIYMCFALVNKHYNCEYLAFFFKLACVKYFFSSYFMKYYIFLVVISIYSNNFGKSFEKIFEKWN